jgi:hypothetical protein
MRREDALPVTVFLAVVISFMVALAVVADGQSRAVLDTCGGWSTTAPDGTALCLPLPPPNDETPQPYHPNR